jgi:membrane-associated protease RseP (regulator of RpoE activity)
MQLLGILAFVIALLLSVMIHEFGHFITAKRFNMKVTEFFLGFGKRLWSTTRGETEFGIKAIPAGGYCKISGMVSDEVMAPGEEGRAFYKASSGKKLIVLGAGSFLHFVLGFILLLSLFLSIGTTRATSTISEVSKCVPAAALACSNIDPVSPAQKVGLQAGDQILAINGDAVTNWGKDVEVIRNSPGKEITLTVKRKGQTLVIAVTPAIRKVDGKIYGFLGIVNSAETHRSSPIKAAINTSKLSWQFISGSATSIISLPSKIPALWGATISGDERDPNGLVGIVGVAQVSGQTVSSSALTPTERIATFILLIASLNFFVGVFNLLPILPLDGGHMAIAIADEIRALFARMRGRARPSPLDLNIFTPITTVVFILLAGLTLLLLAADIFNPVHLNL